MSSWSGPGYAQSHRLAGQAGGLPVVRRVVQKPLASLPGDDVDHRALHVAELGGRADGLDLHFLNEVDAGLGSRHAVARAGEVRAVDEKLFSLVPEPNADTLLVVPLDGEVGEMPGAALIESNMLNRRVGIALRSSGPKRVPNPLSRASMREPAPSTTIDSAMPATFRTAVLSMVAPAADADVLLVIGPESLDLDVEHVRSGRQGREAQLASFVGGHRLPRRQSVPAS